MATIHDWLEGARVRTLPAAVAPVLAGTGVAIAEEGFSFPRALLAAAVALFFQIGVNFANDYSDGIRGTDDVRSGPPRLTGGGKTSPGVVKRAAFAFFALGALAGLTLVVLSGQWWLIGAGLAAVVAAWYYTGGKHPYGYMGLGEVFVMIFFGYMATVGTTYTQTGTAPWMAWVAGTGIGLIACALLMVNNIRDIPTDSQTGKHTLAVRLGEGRARVTFVAMLVGAVACYVVIGLWHWPTLSTTAFIGVGPIVLASPVLRGASGRELIPVLRNTGLFELLYGVVLLVTLAV
ncbi:1,4-dihydroxy-2-naphthoate polyprenyltransferase [Trueperella pecoris]|uniref:1,4-dihydroxy-2-naphthoate octaprenyltransferase n=1 Tax=Trueperella pecoris TaxID=2733571 RepID=A0A7M1QXI5_9ACTO|nr:1,4-dihydroxy-2-naphthoate polyprenyltransferase [Trueperella pecoris]QOQ39313.1 1,4-dihydroxy-2-naphthoate polyprenyltransferase [Trueperella pecoris]QOR46045.1 1,4-dihydroxy-2-naphthoate polyprenyltransferase [Trueperella pecoris]QTG75877.1 1,4-dihydroxy-2-naphthoate polyprenyltransferase [Trueperella pecoris]